MAKSHYQIEQEGIAEQLRKKKEKEKYQTIISGSDVATRPVGQPLLTGEGAAAVREQRERAAKQRKRGALSRLAMLTLGGRYSSVVD